MGNQYSITEFVKNLYSLVITKLVYPRARLIRRPFFIRGKSSMVWGIGFTVGYNCRFDLPGHRKQTLFIGKNCKIGDNVHIVAHRKVEIGNNVLMASKVFISDTEHGNYTGDNFSSPEIPPDERVLVSEPVRIGDNVWIGENVVILKGVNIGSGAIIGANAVITHDIPTSVIVTGAPARIIKKWNQNNQTWESV